jgi:hypothetical protein
MFTGGTPDEANGLYCFDGNDIDSGCDNVSRPTYKNANNYYLFEYMNYWWVSTQKGYTGVYENCTWYALDGNCGGGPYPGLTPILTGWVGYAGTTGVISESTCP